MINEQKYNRLKRQLKKLEQEQERAVGKKQQILAQLKEEFGVKDLAGAKKKLKTLKRQQAENEIKFQTELKKFEKKFKRLIERNSEEDSED